MGGPGVDPNWNGTTTEAYAWGQRQAARALSDIANGYFDYKVVWMDVELPGITPAPDKGWNAVYTSPCSGVVKQSYVPTSVDRADFNGFAAYVAAHSSYKIGVYTSAGVWASILGTGTDSLIPNTYEWTYEAALKGHFATCAPTRRGTPYRGRRTGPRARPARTAIA
jgi:hypothetical protein